MDKRKFTECPICGERYTGKEIEQTTVDYPLGVTKVYEVKITLSFDCHAEVSNIARCESLPTDEQMQCFIYDTVKSSLLFYQIRK